MNREANNTQNTNPHAGSDTPLLTFNFEPLIQQMKQEESWAKSGRSAKTLYKADQMRIVLNVMKAGTEIKPHHANGPISVQVIEGQIRFSMENESVELRQGEMLTLQAQIRHWVEAIEEASFLLTVAP